MKKRSLNALRISLSSALALALLFAVSCAPERIDGVAPDKDRIDYHIDSTSYESMCSSTPKRISESIGSAITIDAKVDLPSSLPPTSLSAESRRIDKRAEKVAKVLLGNAPYATESFQSDDTRWNDKEDMTDRYFETEDAILYVGPDSIFYQRKNFEERYVGTGADAPVTESVAPFKEEELEGFSSQEAIAHVEEILNAIGIQDIASINAYALHAMQMQEIKDAYVAEMGDSFPESEGGDDANTSDEGRMGQELSASAYTNEDEMYSVHVQLAIGSVPLEASTFGMRYNMSASYECLEPCYLRAYVGREGVRFLTSSNLFNGGSGCETGSEVIVTLDEALNALAQKYGSIVSSESMRVNRVALEYCPVFDGTSETGIVLVPAWIFRNADDPDYAIRVNALTAEVI